LETQKITASHQMQSHMAILIAYCIGNFCWKRPKTAPFHIKSP